MQPRCAPTAASSGARLYYIATCSSSNLNPNSVTFFTDSSCTTAAASATPAALGTPAGTMAALEYPCVSLTATSSISAGSWNEALYGMGSVFLWTSSSMCQGMFNAAGREVVSFPQFPSEMSRASHECAQYAASTTCHPALTSAPQLFPMSQANFSPADGECVRPNIFPANEFSLGALRNRPISWRFFLGRNSQACKSGVTNAAMIPSGNGNGVSGSRFHQRCVASNIIPFQELYAFCVNAFRDVSPLSARALHVTPLAVLTSTRTPSSTFA